MDSAVKLPNGRDLGSLDLGQQGFAAFYTHVIRTCSNAEDLSSGKQVHAQILQSEHAQNRYLCNLLIDMYGKCGDPWAAQEVFDAIEQPNVFSWTMITAAYAQNGYLRAARRLFDSTPLPNVISWNSMIAAYAQNGNVEEARAMFEKMPQPDVVSWTTMVAAYAQNGNLAEASSMFDKMTCRNVVSWNAMIAALAKHGNLEEARRMFDQMPHRDVVSWNAIIAAYAHFGYVEDAKEMFEKMPVQDVVSWTTMVTAYAQKGYIEDARSMFDAMPHRNVVSWNALITAYAQKGHLDEARILFDKMSERDAVSWNTMVAAYGREGHLQEARNMFEEMPLTDVVSWNAMLGAYAQNGHLDEARSMFDNMPRRDVLSWNTMISACAQNRQGEEGIELYRRMETEGVHPDEVTFVNALDACASITSLADGKAIHDTITRSGSQSAALGNALLNMYGKCGDLEAATSTFNRMESQNEVSWGAMISAYNLNGQFKEAMKLLVTISLEGVQANDIIFTAIFTACSHMGMLENAWKCFMSLASDHGLQPVADHYACMVDLLGRSGRLEEAEELMKLMPFEPDIVTWVTMLGACRVHGDSARGKRISGHVFELHGRDPAAYVLLSNMTCEGWQSITRMKESEVNWKSSSLTGKSWKESYLN